MHLKITTLEPGLTTTIDVTGDPADLRFLEGYLRRTGTVACEFYDKQYKAIEVKISREAMEPDYVDFNWVRLGVGEEKTLREAVIEDKKMLAVAIVQANKFSGCNRLEDAKRFVDSQWVRWKNLEHTFCGDRPEEPEEETIT